MSLLSEKKQQFTQKGKKPEVPSSRREEKRTEVKKNTDIWKGKGSLSKGELKRKFKDPSLFTKTGGMTKKQRSEFFEKRFKGKRYFIKKGEERKVLKELRREAHGPTAKGQREARQGLRLMREIFRKK